MEGLHKGNDSERVVGGSCSHGHVRVVQQLWPEVPAMKRRPQKEVKA